MPKAREIWESLTPEQREDIAEWDGDEGCCCPFSSPPCGFCESLSETEADLFCQHGDDRLVIDLRELKHDEEGRDTPRWLKAQWAREDRDTRESEAAAAREAKRNTPEVRQKRYEAQQRRNKKRREQRRECKQRAAESFIRGLSEAFRMFSGSAPDLMQDPLVRRVNEAAEQIDKSTPRREEGATDGQ